MTAEQLNINEVFIVQEYVDQLIVNEKIENEDFDISVAMLADDGQMIPILVDGHHSLHAALQTGNTPIIHIVECELANDVESYVISCGERSNPETLDGETLW